MKLFYCCCLCMYLFWFWGRAEVLLCIRKPFIWNSSFIHNFFKRAEKSRRFFSVNHSITNFSRADGSSKEMKSGLPFTCLQCYRFPGLCKLVQAYQPTLRMVNEVKFRFIFSLVGYWHINIKTTVSASPQQRPNFGLQSNSSHWSGNDSNSNISPPFFLPGKIQ